MFCCGCDVAFCCRPSTGDGGVPGERRGSRAAEATGDCCCCPGEGTLGDGVFCCGCALAVDGTCCHCSPYGQAAKPWKAIANGCIRHLTIFGGVGRENLWPRVLPCVCVAAPRVRTAGAAGTLMFAVEAVCGEGAEATVAVAAPPCCGC